MFIFKLVEIDGLRIFEESFNSIVTAKEFEQGIKTDLNKLSEQDTKQIRNEFSSEPDYPIPNQISKK